MLIMAAVDIKEKKAVRLTSGDFKKDKVYFDNPLQAARLWESQGVGFLHVVDLEGALAGRLKNFKSIKAICEGVNIPVEVGGGIRSEEEIRKILDIGAKRVILGTAAVGDKIFLKRLIKKFKKKIIISIDVVDDKIAIRGWKDRLRIEAIPLIKELKSLGIERIIYTDIKRDGTLKGVRWDVVKDILKKTGINLFFAGGISSLQDIIELKKLEKDGLLGIIIGKALYEGKVDLRCALYAAGS